ncbi:MAG TPA: peptidoglycan editing factor PgeF [Legionellaceae bacterium]|nr:peptidoglycan editing factor PgeF [Legionellaceae bacterium]
MNTLEAQWPAPPHIRALTTHRTGGVSQAPYDSFNLAKHVGDDPQHVATNRLLLRENLHLPNEPIWLEQTHSTHCVVVEDSTADRNADAALTRKTDQVLAIMTADCLPITICNRQGSEIAAIHAGWRGLAGGILDNTTALISAQLQDCLAWIGPAICGQCYETGEEVLEQFRARYPFATQAFHRQGTQWYADLPKISILILQALGITAVYPSHACTFESHSQFYSYRRAAQTGRIATLIWFQGSL